MLGRTRCLCSDQLYAESVREPAGDLVLNGEQIGRVAVETLCPQMRVRRGIDQLGADTDLVARSPDAPFEHIANAELMANCRVLTGLPR